jgi:hypothetical protein
MRSTATLSVSTAVLAIALAVLPARADEFQMPRQVKVAAVQMLGYDKTDVPRPGFDPSEAVVRYIQKAAIFGQPDWHPPYSIGLGGKSPSPLRVLVEPSEEIRHNPTQNPTQNPIRLEPVGSVRRRWKALMH